MAFLFSVVITFENINGGVELENLADLAQEVDGTIRLERHREQAPVCQIMRHLGIRCVTVSSQYRGSRLSNALWSWLASSTSLLI